MTQTELANIALGLLGSESITDFTERTPAAEKVRRHWPPVRDALLRSKNWNFATKRVTLSADADNAPEFDWTYAYALPNDYLKAIEFNGQQAGTGEAEFEISGRFVLSNDDAAELKYTCRLETVSEWDPSFQDAFAHALAAALAPGLSTAPGLGMTMRQRAEEIAVQAAGPNSVETRPRAVLAQTGSGWLNARNGIE